MRPYTSVMKLKFYGLGLKDCMLQAKIVEMLIYKILIFAHNMQYINAKKKIINLRECPQN